MERSIHSKSTGLMQSTESSSHDGARHTGHNSAIRLLESPIKSPNDKKDYRAIQLANGLRAILISDMIEPMSVDDAKGAEDSDSMEEESSSGSDNSDDEEAPDTDEEDHMKKAACGTGKQEKMSAAALCIAVGSFSDPENVPGLAHFLEHMVFMGSEMYPAENAFDAFIKKYGGSDNASTDCEHTNFYFEIQRNKFSQGLKRFAQFFVSPLLKKDSMQREREAVNSEFEMALQSDEHRTQQLFGSLANRGHPMGKYMWGNLETLQNSADDSAAIHHALVKFRRKHYIAPLMTVCVQSPDSLDNLQEWVVDAFSDVPMGNSSHSPKAAYAHLSHPFDNDNFYRLHKVVPVTNANKVTVSWALPSMLKYYRTKPLSYLGWIIGHEGRGSLLAYLRSKVWAISLCSGTDYGDFEHNSTCATYFVSISLTDEGLHCIWKVLDALFSYISLLRNAGPLERVFNEMKKCEDLAFQFVEEISPVDNVESIAGNMHLYPLKDCITGDSLFFEYDPGTISSVLKQLVPNRANIMLFSKQFEGECHLREPWFKTSYSVQDIPQEFIQRWQDIKPKKQFHMPEPNRYLPENLDLLPKLSENPRYPQKILQDDGCEVWYRRDDVFLVPKAMFFIFLASPLPQKSPTHAALLRLMSGLIEQHLVEDAYAAELAKLSYSVAAAEKGLIIRVNGFNDKLIVLLETIIDHLCTFESRLRPDLFESFKRETEKAYFNYTLKPGKLCKDIRINIIQDVHWLATQKRQALVNMTNGYTVMCDFAAKFRSHLYAQILVQGNITEDRAIAAYQMLRSRLNFQPLTRRKIPRTCAVQMPVGAQFVRVRNANQDDNNSVVTNYYQNGFKCEVADVKTWCCLQVIQMLTEEPLFDILRTQEQLGYHVECRLSHVSGVYAFIIIVNSHKFSADHIDERIEAFLTRMNADLNSLTVEQLHPTVESLIRSKRCVDIQLDEEVERNWNEIVSAEYLFNRLSQEIECLEKLTLHDVQNCFSRVCCSDERRKLTVQIAANSSCVGSPNILEKADQLDFFTSDQSFARHFIGNIQRFKKDLMVYPPTMS